MMAPEPVTQRVNIYQHAFNVRYPSHNRLQELQQEFATQCKGACKPGSNRRYFVCIHCGQADFSNKMQLNKHRYMEGCEAATYSDGTQALLLPYPDFLPGQGKMVEVLAKDAARKGAPVDAEEDDDGTETDFEEDDNAPGRALGAGRKARRSATRVPPPADLLFGAAPPKAGGAVPKAKPGKKSHAAAKGKISSQPLLPAKPTVEANSQSQTRSRGQVAPGSCVTAKTKVMGQSKLPFTEEDVSKPPSMEEDSRPAGPLRFGLRVRGSTLQSRRDADAAGAHSSAAPPPKQTMEAQMQAVLNLALRGAFKKLPQSSTARTGGATEGQGGRPVAGSRCPIPNAAVAEGDTALGSLARQCHLKRKPTSDTGASQFRVSKRVHFAGTSTAADSPTTEQTTPLAESCTGLGASVDYRCEEPAIGDGQNGDDAAAILGSLNATAAPPTPDTVDTDPEQSLRDTVSKMVVWEEKFESNKQLLHYWAEGKGSPRPFTYHPGLEEKHIAREKVLDRQEELFVAMARRKADDTLMALTPPVCPREVKVPGLFLIREFVDVVTLPWAWDCRTADEFRSRWEENIWTDDFEDLLMRCLYWWTKKKTDKSIPGKVRDTISCSLESLIASRGDRQPFPGLGDLASYVQYTTDYAKFKDDSATYLDRLAQRNEETVAQARRDFRERNAFLREEILWDWCPIWRVVVANKGLLRMLPKLPWTHDDAESSVVRRVLIFKRVPPVRPSPLLMVFRVMFWNFFGVFRQLSCPLYGLTRDVIIESCKEDMKIRRALAVFIAQGPFLFAGFGDESSETLHHRLSSEIAQIRAGSGEAIISDVVDWITNVQLRALQDHAAALPSEFQRAWCTLHYEHWGQQSKYWGRTLRLREDRDMGWVSTTETPFWSSEVDSLQRSIKSQVRDIAAATAIEDYRQWDTYARDAGVGEPILLTFGGEEGECDDKKGFRVDAVELLGGPYNSPVGSHRVDFLSGEVVDLGADEVPLLCDGSNDPYSITPTPQKTQVVSPPGIQEKEPVTNVRHLAFDPPEAPKGPSPSSLLPGLAEAMGDRITSNDGGPMLTVTQVVRSLEGAEGGAIPDANMEVGSLSQWVETQEPMDAVTPRNGVTLVSTHGFGNCRPSTDTGACVKLQQQFEDERDLEAVNHLVDLSHGFDRGGGAGPSQQTGGTSSLVLSSKGVSSATPTSGDCFIFALNDVPGRNLPQAYKNLKVEALLQALPRVGLGSEKGNSVVFFNQLGKEVEVKFAAIRALQKVKTRLCNDVVDVVMSRLYYQYPDRDRRHIHVVTSRVSSAMTHVMKRRQTMDAFAQDYLQPPPPVKPHEVKEMIVPWVFNDHWSLLIFQPDRVFHMDSSDGKYHQPLGRDSEFVRWMTSAWQHLRGVEEYPVEKFVSQPVFQQRGNTECGHCCIRNATLYLKYRGSRAASRESDLHLQLQMPITPKDMNARLLALLATEVDPGRRDTRFAAPFCPPPSPERKTPVVDIDFDEEPPASPERRLTRGNAKGGK